MCTWSEIVRSSRGLEAGGRRRRKALHRQYDVACLDENEIIDRQSWPLGFYYMYSIVTGWLDSRVVSVLDSGAEGPGFKSQSRRCWVTVLGKLFTPIVPLFNKQQNW